MSDKKDSNNKNEDATDETLSQSGEGERAESSQIEGDQIEGELSDKEQIQGDANPDQTIDAQETVELEQAAIPKSDPEASDSIDQSAEKDPEPTQDTSIEAPAPVVKPKGRVLAAFAFLFALLAVAGVGYLYYLLVYLQPLENVRSESSQLSAQYADLETRMRKQMQDLQTASSAALQEVQAEQAERLANNEDAVLDSLNEALNAAPPSQREWKLAEAEYLLRIANHRVLMEQDSVGALTLLQAADQIMAELDDFALHQVRARLADEIIGLRQVPRDDLQGVYLRIEALKSQFDDLPLPIPEFLQTEQVPEPEKSVWQTLMDEFKKFVRIRTLASDEVLKPLLAPEEEQYLELNLRLALEQAQLATLKRQQEIYIQSLQKVRQWLLDHADIEDARTEALLESVDELLVVELARPLPEISGSLNELLSIRRSGS